MSEPLICDLRSPEGRAAVEGDLAALYDLVTSGAARLLRNRELARAATTGWADDQLDVGGNDPRRGLRGWLLELLRAGFRHLTRAVRPFDRMLSAQELTHA